MTNISVCWDNKNSGFDPAHRTVPCVIQCVIQYINGIDLQDYIDEIKSAQLIYNCIADYISYLPETQRGVLGDYCDDRMEYCLNGLHSFSIQNNFYGLQLAEAVGFRYNINGLVETCTSYYKTMLDGINKDMHPTEVERLITETYYYTQIVSQVNSITNSEAYLVDKALIREMVEFVSDAVCANEIKNPRTIRKLCEILSNENVGINKKLYRYIKQFIEDYSSNQYVIGSSYFCDLLVIDKIWGSNILSSVDVSKKIQELKDGAFYKDEISGERSLLSTFEVYSIRSRFEGLEISEREAMDCYSEAICEADNYSNLLDIRDMYYLISLLNIDKQ